MNCTVLPFETVGAAGVICRATATGTPVTVSNVFPLMLPKVAVIVDVPGPTVVANPVFPPIFATSVFALVQVTCVVMSCVGPEL